VSGLLSYISETGRIERRGHLRLRLALPCHRAPGNGCGRRPVGATINLSRNGVLIAWRTDLCERIPCPGEALKVDVELPSNSFGNRYLRCGGTVVRVSRSERGWLEIALSIAQMDFCDGAGHIGSAAYNPDRAARQWLQ
jgi:hypothetical protein